MTQRAAGNKIVQLPLDGMKIGHQKLDVTFLIGNRYFAQDDSFVSCSANEWLLWPGEWRHVSLKTQNTSAALITNFIHLLHLKWNCIAMKKDEDVHGSCKT